MAGKDVLGKLLYLAVVHARPIVFLLVAAGYMALGLLPLAERQSFFDENALLVGSASPTVECASCLPIHLALYPCELVPCISEQLAELPWPSIRAHSYGASVSHGMQGLCS